MTNTFLTLLELQEQGDVSAADRIRLLELSEADSPLLWMLHQQWLQAFSYEPGRLEAIRPILALARKVSRWKTRNVGLLYKQPDWQQLCELRGPIEFVELYRCVECQRESHKMCISPFVGEIGFVCDGCGDVLLRYAADDSPLPMCRCGMPYVLNEPRYCSACRRTCKKIRVMSPFEYFANHNYQR